MCVVVWLGGVGHYSVRMKRKWYINVNQYSQAFHCVYLCFAFVWVVPSHVLSLRMIHSHSPELRVCHFIWSTVGHVSHDQAPVPRVRIGHQQSILVHCVSNSFISVWLHDLAMRQDPPLPCVALSVRIPEDDSNPWRTCKILTIQKNWRIEFQKTRYIGQY